MKLKDKKIEILAVQNVVSENGYAVETLKPICPPVYGRISAICPAKNILPLMPNRSRKKCCFR